MPIEAIKVCNFIKKKICPKSVLQLATYSIYLQPKITLCYGYVGKDVHKYSNICILTRDKNKM